MAYKNGFVFLLILIFPQDSCFLVMTAYSMPPIWNLSTKKIWALIPFLEKSFGVCQNPTHIDIHNKEAQHRHKMYNDIIIWKHLLLLWHLFQSSKQTIHHFVIIAQYHAIIKARHSIMPGNTIGALTNRLNIAIYRVHSSLTPI